MKRILSICLAVLMLLCALPMSAGAFSDIKDPETARDAAVLEQLGVINGVGGGRFDPSGTLTRAQFCKMVVYIMGKQGEAAQYSASSVFTDVRGSHWASGYIHYCVKNKIVLGIGDGSFAPDREIFFSEAITVLMRALGYKDTDFSLAWPAGYLAAASSNGLSEGLGLGAKNIITRAQAVKLFKNMLLTKNTDGVEFAASVYGALTDKALVTGVDGEKITAFWDSKLTELTANAKADQSIVGKTCRFITDSKGLVLAVLSVKDEYTAKTVTISEAQYTALLDTNGGRHTISDDTLVYVDGKAVNYTTAWTSIRAGSSMTAYYNALGRCVLVTVQMKSSANSEVVVLKGAPSNLSSLALLFGLDSTGSYTLYKNGTISGAGGLAKYDVVTYNKATRTFYASDFRLSAFFESAWPNYETPTKLTIFNTQFDLSAAAQEQLKSFKKGDKLTVLLTDDLRIGAVLSASELSASPVTYVGQASKDATTVTFANGLTLTCRLSNMEESLNKVSHTLVTVSSASPGAMTLQTRTLVRPNKKLDIENRTLGNIKLSSSCVVFDSVEGRCMRQVSFSDLTVSAVQAGDVRHAEYDSAGRVSLLVLNNVTGLCYDYGILEYESRQISTGNEPIDPPYNVPEGTPKEMPEYGNYIGVKNSAADPEMYYYSPATYYMNGKLGGIATEGSVVRGYLMLTSASCGRADFKDGYVNANGLLIPISSQLKVYIKDTDTWDATLDEARSASDKLTVYYDRPPVEGGQVRVVVAG